MYDLAIIGGGPAGIAAASYALHAQLDVAFFAPELGGKVNYRFALRDQEHVDTVWGAELVRQLEGYVKANLDAYIEARASRLFRHDDGGFGILTDDEVAARAVVVATGARPQRLYVPGEETYRHHGVSFSAISHAPLFSGKDVAVVGSGDRAVIASLELAPLADHVYLIIAQPDTLSGAHADSLADRPALSVFHGWEVERIKGDGTFVTGIELLGRDGARRHLAAEGVFIEFGLVPNSDLVRNVADLDEVGRIKINHRCETSVPGLFAAGDVTNVYAEQVPVAIGEGAKAALSAWEYLATEQAQ